MDVERATFEKVKNAQLSLIFDYLQELIEKKETIAKQSRRGYFELLSISTIGQLHNHNYILHYNNNTYDLGNLSIFSRKMAYFVDTKDKKQPLKLKGKYLRVPIDLLWETLQENLYQPFDEALLLAHRSSAEVIKHSSSGYEFKPKGDK